jgi:AraC-like DNA-binding protein
MMYFDDPAEFEVFLSPVGGDVQIRPAAGSSFNAEISIGELEYVALFKVSANSFKAVKEPQQDFYGLTVPLGAPFTVSEHGQNKVYDSSSAHLLLPGYSFDLTAKRNCQFLVGNFLSDPVSAYLKKVFQSDSWQLSSLGSDVSFDFQPGSSLLRSVAKAWSTLNNNIPVNEITLKELEDDLLASFVLYISEDADTGDNYKQGNLRHLNRAEEYIRENLQSPITRDQLAEASCCSIRTLSRAFERKHGAGPMAFIKQRRLDAAYLDLLSARPDMTSVTKVAYDYGFVHIGKFAIEYGKTFGELPSTSLAR